MVAKAKVDYFGFINNKYVEIECKQTKHQYFDMQLLKHHQIDYLKQIDNIGCLAFVFIYFELYDKIIGLTYGQLLKCRKQAKKNALPFDLVAEHGTEIEVVYPGILNIIKLF